MKYNTNKGGDNMKEKRYTSGEIASAAGLTIRAVQYYDKIGLLRPTERTAAGRRYYTHDDLIRLEQIVLYKSLDFSLEQIKEKLLFQPDSDGLLEMFNSQCLLLLQRMEHLHTSFFTLGLMADMIKMGKDLPLTLLLQILSAVPADDIFSKAPQMLTEEQQSTLSVELHDFEATKQFYHRCKEILIEAMILQSEELSPSSPEVQELIKQWWKEIVSFASGNMDIIRELSQLNIEDQLIIRNVEMMKSAKQFMTDAFKIYADENNLTFDMDKSIGKGRDKSDTTDKPNKKVR